MKTIVDRINTVNRHAAAYFRAKLRSSRRAREYLYGRLTKKTVRQFGLGYAPRAGLVPYLNKQNLSDQDVILSGVVYVDADQTATDVFSNRIMFPIVHAGRILGFGGRTLLSAGSAAKYINTRHTPVYNKRTILYGLHQARKYIHEQGCAILVEGYFDFLALWEARVRNVVGTCGTAFTREQTQLLERYADYVYTFFDGDPPGRESATRAAEILDEFDLYGGNVRTPEGTDPAEFIAKHGRSGLKTLHVT